VAEVVKRFPEIKRARLVVMGEMANDQMCIKVEATETDGLSQKIGDAVRDITKLRAEVVFAAEGSLPNDGKVIEDARTYQ
jgi:phenylacetate-CoA ligase